MSKKIPSRKRLRIGQLRQFIGAYDDSHFHIIDYDPNNELFGETWIIRLVGNGDIKQGSEEGIIYHSILIQEPRLSEDTND
jgi:hypothetical protein